MTGRPVSIVGIGASAGGLDAFRNFFRNMPPNSNLAFVVLLHLPIGRRSMLPEIIARWTQMRVVEASDGDLVEPNVVYIAPPHAVVGLREACLLVQIPDADAPREHRPIDVFFDSLAADLQENAVGIVLSGTGSDGSLGLKAIKEYGGLTIAQGSDGSGPEHGGMPAGAIATGVVDLIALVEDIPAHLLRLRPRQTPTGKPATNEPSPEQATAARLEICAILRNQVGHDFSGYKETTFLRRVQRRMQVLNLTDFARYVERLRQDHAEVRTLFRDLLIRATSFFRDKEAFETLERLVMPELFAGKQADSTVRVWVPGCATGEEAYSLAILLREQMDRLQTVPKVQLFATDIDENSVSTARLGRYPTVLLEGISEERRERFFLPSAAGYIVTQDIRALCTFSTHSVVRDPPFSRMDMISCRNLLIYLDLGLQADVLPAFHYSLNPNGILLLGISESTARHEELFEPLDKAARIFRKRSVRSPPLDLRAPHRALPPAEPVALAPLPLGLREPVSMRRGGTAPVRGGVAGAQMNPPSRDLLVTAWDMLRTRIGSVLNPSALAFGQLEQELRNTRAQLQAITEEHETALEELRSANEELHSVNEELQSTNEELETSKEEIQSVNEELHTVNTSLSEKVEEVDRANGDLRNLFASTEIATVFLDRYLIIRSFTPAVGSIYNLIPSDQGRPLTDIVSQLQYGGVTEDVAHVLDTLQPLERRVTHRNGQTHYIMRVLPYRAPDSTVSGTLITFTDVTGIVRAEQHQRLLVDELNHRVKNMLTVVDSLAVQTLRRSQSLDEFGTAFTGRVRALTASYALLSGHNWMGVSLRALLVEEVKPYWAQDGANIVLQGPEIRMGSAGAVAMGMAVHELATNAVKYGALSTPEGIVTVTWRIEDHRSGSDLVVDWVEANGPPVQTPTRRGFGTTLIERGFTHELSGKTSLDFLPDGVRASLRAPVEAAIVDESLGERTAPT